MSKPTKAQQLQERQEKSMQELRDLLPQDSTLYGIQRKTTRDVNGNVTHYFTLYYEGTDGELHSINELVADVLPGARIDKRTLYLRYDMDLFNLSTYLGAELWGNEHRSNGSFVRKLQHKQL